MPLLIFLLADISSPAPSWASVCRAAIVEAVDANEWSQAFRLRWRVGARRVELHYGHSSPYHCDERGPCWYPDESLRIVARRGQGISLVGEEPVPAAATSLDAWRERLAAASAICARD